LVGEAGPNGNVYYHADALGSVTMTSDQNGDILNEYRYKPFGTVKTKTGTAVDPKFLWVGTVGYRQTGRIHAEAHSRLRHFGYAEARWVTADPSKLNRGRSPYITTEENTVNKLGSAGSCNLGDFKPYMVKADPVSNASAEYCSSYGETNPYTIIWDIGSLTSQGLTFGWIIQEINFQAFDLASCVSGVANCTFAGETYWEGWYLNGIELIPHPFDYWSWTKECDCHNGSKKQTGIANFYAVDEACATQDWKWVSGGDGGRGILLGGPMPPGWSQGNSTKRSVEAVFECC
jgi:hypothetical protein